MCTGPERTPDRHPRRTDARLCSGSCRGLRDRIDHGREKRRTGERAMQATSSGPGNDPGTPGRSPCCPRSSSPVGWGRDLTTCSGRARAVTVRSGPACVSWSSASACATGSRASIRLVMSWSDSWIKCRLESRCERMLPARRSFARRRRECSPLGGRRGALKSQQTDARDALRQPDDRQDRSGGLRPSLVDVGRRYLVRGKLLNRLVDREAVGVRVDRIDHR